MNNKTINEFGFRRIWRIKQIWENVIHLALGLVDNTLLDLLNFHILLSLIHKLLICLQCMSVSSDVDRGAHEFTSITNDARSLNLLPFGHRCSFATRSFFYVRWNKEAVKSSNTGNIFAQLVAKQRCIASFKALYPVLPPSPSTCHVTNFNVVSCGNMFCKVDPSSTFCNKLSILSLASKNAIRHNGCDWSIFSH